MIACSQKTHWQPPFLQLLPRIEHYARVAFRHLPPDAREEAIQETIANCLVAFVRLWEQGRLERAHPSVLARYGAAQVRDGRSIGHRINSGDVLSLRAYRRHGLQVTRLDEEWREIVVEDKRAKPADVAAMRIDFAEWLRTLSSRVAAIAKMLATGETTTAVARLFGLTCGRISQLRREPLGVMARLPGRVDADGGVIGGGGRWRLRPPSEKRPRHPQHARPFLLPIPREGGPIEVDKKLLPRTSCRAN